MDKAYDSWGMYEACITDLKYELAILNGAKPFYKCTNQTKKQCRAKLGIKLRKMYKTLRR
jgi:hypothetical protein